MSQRSAEGQRLHLRTARVYMENAQHQLEYALDHLRLAGVSYCHKEAAEIYRRIGSTKRFALDVLDAWEAVDADRS